MVYCVSNNILKRSYMHIHYTLYHTGCLCMCICMCTTFKVLFVHSSFLSLHLDHYRCKVGTTKSQTLIDGGVTAVGGATGTSSQKFFAGHSGGLRADIV